MLTDQPFRIPPGSKDMAISKYFRSHALVISVLLIGALMLSGCGRSSTSKAGQSGEKLAGSITELIRQTLQRTDLSEFERTVLEHAASTGKITQADYDEAFSRYEKCVSDLGYTEQWTKLPSGVYRITGVTPLPQGQEELERYAENVSRTCSEGTIGRIEPLFVQQQVNPDLIADPKVLAVQCLVDGGYVDPSYSPDDFTRDFDSNFAQAPFDVMTPELNNCLFAIGYTIVLDQ